MPERAASGTATTSTGRPAASAKAYTHGSTRAFTGGHDVRGGDQAAGQFEVVPHDEAWRLVRRLHHVRGGVCEVEVVKDCRRS